MEASVQGCDKCFRPDQKNKVNDALFGDLYARTLARDDAIAACYEYKTVWECEIRRMLIQDEEMREHFKTCKVRQQF